MIQGLRLKELRIERNLTQKEIAVKLGLTAHNIGDWERGKAEPSAFWLTKLADFFECSIDYLLGREDDFGVLQNITAEEYEQGARYTKMVSVTPDEEEVFDKIKEVLAEIGEDGKNLIIDFCDVLLSKFKNKP